MIVPPSGSTLPPVAATGFPTATAGLPSRLPLWRNWHQHVTGPGFLDISLHVCGQKEPLLFERLGHTGDRRHVSYMVLVTLFQREARITAARRSALAFLKDMCPAPWRPAVPHGHAARGRRAGAGATRRWRRGRKGALFFLSVRGKKGRGERADFYPSLWYAIIGSHYEAVSLKNTSI
jgi:hypothetical protein